MYSITTAVLALDEAKRLFPCQGFDRLCRAPVSCNVLWGSEFLLSPPGGAVPMSVHGLLVRVPGTDREALRCIASSELRLMNLDSASLQRQESFVVLGSENEGLYIPMRRARSLSPETECWTFECALIGDDCVLHAQHVLSGDDLDIYLVGCQAVSSCSGLNYNAARIYSQDALESVAHYGDHIVSPGRMVHLLG